MHTSARRHAHTDTHARRHTHTHTCTHADTHTRTQTHTHTHTHIHKSSGVWAGYLGLCPPLCCALTPQSHTHEHTRCTPTPSHTPSPTFKCRYACARLCDHGEKPSCVCACAGARLRVWLCKCEPARFHQLLAAVALSGEPNAHMGCVSQTTATRRESKTWGGCVGKQRSL